MPTSSSNLDNNNSGTPDTAEQPASPELQAFMDKADQIKKQLRQETLSQQELEQKYLGKNGEFNQLSQKITDLKPEERRKAGLILNHLKEDVENYIRQLAGSGAEPLSHRDLIDITLPGQKPNVGHMHPISQAIEEISGIFENIGFVRARYPEVDWDRYAFESLNMPQDHPARDEWETFFIDQEPHPEKGQLVLTPHTSNGQVREMERVLAEQGGPPIRMINIARCYRRQQDVTHTQMFHQFEGLVIDKGINLQHLKGTIDYFARMFFGPNAKSRIRPFHFKFTEPSLEVDFSCQICGGSGYLETEEGKVECRFCKSGWHEAGGAGMVHPNVLEAGGIDPEEYTGFAFGWGVERTYTLQQGLNIDDVRLLYSAKLDFLKQF